MNIYKILYVSPEGEKKVIATFRTSLSPFVHHPSNTNCRKIAFETFESYCNMQGLKSGSQLQLRYRSLQLAMQEF